MSVQIDHRRRWPALGRAGRPYWPAGDAMAAARVSLSAADTADSCASGNTSLESARYHFANSLMSGSAAVLCGAVIISRFLL